MSTARIAHYRVRFGSAGEVSRRLEVAVLPVLRDQPGFIAYEVIQVAPDQLVSISSWRNRTQAEEAIELTALDQIQPGAIDLIDLHLGQIAFRHLPAQS